MVLPLHLVFVRHGESSGNLAMAAARRGDESHFDEDYVTTPGRLWQLTPTGVEQARCAGEWLNSELACGTFSDAPRKYYASPLVRTRQTAGHLGLEPAAGEEEVRWRLNRSIRERDWGDIETILKREFRAAYPHNAHREKADPLYWRPPGGESIADVADLRVRNFFDTLHRENSTHTVVGVTHGEFMRAVHLVLTRGNDEKYSEWVDTGGMKFSNCEVLHYTRRIPKAMAAHGRPGSLVDRIAYFRRARPVLQEDGSWRQEVDPWEHIEFTTYSNEDFLHL